MDDPHPRYKGVYPHGNRWQALIRMGGRLLTLGTFRRTPSGAAIAAAAHDAAAEFLGQKPNMLTEEDVLLQTENLEEVQKAEAAAVRKVSS